MKRWLTAVAALAAGAVVTGVLLVMTDPSRGASNVWATVRDLPAGAQLDGQAIALIKVGMGADGPLLFSAGEEQSLLRLRTTHNLVAGQLIQRSDVTASPAATDIRLVFVPLKDTPPVVGGSRVDLLVIDGAPDHVTVEPFATKVEVRAATGGGLVLAVPSQQAAAFVYAAAAMDLAAVVAEPGAADGTELPVSSSQQAIDLASH
ncbi:MAG: hypothetical protein ACHQ0J_13845 [Candidatus Dormibacterales bacterium]